MSVLAAGPHAGSPVVGGLLVAAFLVLLLVSYGRDRERAPFVPCRSCRGGVVEGWKRDEDGDWIPQSARPA